MTDVTAFSFSDWQLSVIFASHLHGIEHFKLYDTSLSFPQSLVRSCHSSPIEKWIENVHSYPLTQHQCTHSVKETNKLFRNAHIHTKRHFKDQSPPQCNLKFGIIVCALLSMESFNCIMSNLQKKRKHS